MKARILFLVPLLCLGACSTPPATRSPIAAQELGALVQQPPSKAKMVTLRFTVIGDRGQKVNGPIATYPVSSSKWLVEPKTHQRLPTITTRTIQPEEGKVEIIHEFVYPTRLELPKISPAPAQPVPTTPTKFETKNVGWTIDGITVVPHGAFYMVYGRFLETTFDGFIDNPGDGFRPITSGDGRVLTDNRAQSPTFTTRETPLVISALPGKTYRLPLNLRQSGTVLEVSCSVVDPSGQTVESAKPLASGL